MSRFLRFCAFLSVLFLATNVFAAGYTCPTAKRYTSCATNYYVSDCGTTFNGRTLTTDDLTAGNSCEECPDGYTCSGGLVCPRVSQVTIAYVTGNTTLGQSQPLAGVATSLATISRMSTGVPAALKNTDYGWTFAGWATAPNTNEVTYTDGQSVTLTENTVLYGVWERTITVNYYASATARTVTSVGMSQYYRNTSTTVAGVSTVARPALVASNYGWNPIGWSYGTTTTPNITTITNTAVTIPVGVPAALNAVYTRSSGVTYNGNGNTGGSTNATAYTQLFNAANGAADSVSVTLASNGFTKTGHTFSKWAAGSTSGTQYAAGATFTPTNTAWTSASSYTMYAIWAANTYTVSFDANGGSGGQSANVTATYDNAMPSISTTAPTRTGYTFMGWYDNQTYTSGTQYYTAAGASARTWNKTANTTLYAGWKANDIYVRLDKNGGSGTCLDVPDTAISTLACTYNSNCVLPVWNSTTCNIVNTTSGHTHEIFTGWNTAEDGSGTTYAPGANVKNIISSGVVMLYAVWTNPTGNIVNGQAAFVTPVGNAPTANVVCNTGYQTSGTYSGTAGNPNFSYTCTAISYTCAAGKYLPKSSTSCASCPAGRYCAGGTYSYNESSDQGITGVCASGYSTGGASASTCTACTSGYAASGTAYTAHDQKADCKRTITLNKNGGSGTILGVSGTTSASVVCSEGVACSFGDASVLTQTGYTFKTGWGTSASCTATTNSFTTPTSSTYYACKSANTFPVSYAGNSNTGGSAPTSPTSCTYDSACTAPSNTYTKTGARFTGWKCTGGTTACDGDIIAAGGSLKNVSTGTGITLTAQWTPNVYTVYFKTGSTNMGSQDFTYGVSQKLTPVSALSNIPVSSDYGWRFVGWSSAPDSTVEYEDVESVRNLTTTHGGTVVLYGVWERDVDLLYYGSATAVQPTMTSGVQSYYNSSTTAATRTGIVLPLLSTATSYNWAPYGWALNSNTTTTATVSATTATTVTPAIDVGTTDGLVYTALYKRTATVSYSGNGATGGSTSSTSGTQYFNTGNGAANALTLTLASNGFTKTGYTFSKWAAGNAGAAYTFPNTAWASAASVSTNATWTANKYTVTLDAGDIASGTVYTTYNTAVYTDSARTKAMSTSANAVSGGLLTPKSVTVTYNANGGYVSSTSANAYMPFNGYWSATSGGTQYIGTGGYITDAGLIAAKGYTANKTWYAQWSPTTVSLPTPTRTGYTFKGWATSSSATSGVTGNYSVTGDVTLYATWSANMTGGIVLNSQYFASSSASTGTTVTVSAAPTPIYIKYDTGVYDSTSANATAITKLTTLPTYTGYTFQGFYTGKAGTGAQVIDASGNFLTVTLYPTAGTTATWYAHYTANCNQVLLNANGGTAGSVTKLYKKSGSGTWYTDAACTIGYARLEDVKPTRSDYTFRGFYLDDPADISSSESSGTARYITHTGETTNTGNTWTITGGAVLYAGWARNCEPGDKATCSLTVGQTTTYTTGCDAGYNIKSGANTYAPVCQANTYYVQYDSNVDAAMGTPSWTGFKKLTYTYDTESYLQEAAVLWSGSVDYTYAGKRYSFVGWSRTDGATTPDSDLESPSDTGTKKAWNLTTTNGATVYLYAVWSSCNTCLPDIVGATCDLVDAVTCTYETSCLPGYKEASGAGTYNPQCDPIDYQIKYNANCDLATGGTMANTVLDYDDKVNLTTNGFRCGTKQFLGWADISGCSVTLDGDRTCDVVYTQGQEVEKLTTVDGAVVQLFAVWGDCPACSAGTGASCVQSAPLGVCTYTTSCLAGYNTLVGDGTTNPSCSANRYTVEYNMNCPSGATCSSAPSNTTCTYAKTCIFSDIQSTSLYAGGYKLTGWASTTTGTGEAAGINLTTTNNGTVTRYAIWSKCAAGTYHPAGTGTAANVCTNAADGKFVATAGATADVACAQGSYSEKSSASTQCVACPAGRTTSGTGTKYNATANTACSATCSNNTGVYAWATPSWSNNTVANLCTVTSCSSTYYKNSNACALCSGLASGFYPNSDNGNSSGASACFTNELSGQYVKSANDSAATDCANWTYRPAHSVNYGSTSTCAPCAAVPSAVSGVAWTKASGTRWTSYNQCVVTQTPANCASGTVKRTQTSTTAWGNTKLASTLRSEDGYYADTSATSCTICPSGSYCPAGATSSTRCAVGSYSNTTGQHECVACQDGKTTSGSGQTSCNATCSNTAGVSDWETASWTTSNTITNLCTVAATAGCSENYYKSSNSCLTCSSGTNSKYTLSAAGTTSVNSCYLKTTAGKYVATKGAGETACISPYYCKGGTTVYYGTGTTTGGNAACTGLGSIYTKSDASASAETQCYATTSPGKYVTAKATAEAACPAGDWCEGSVKVYYGSAGGNTDCPDGYTNGTTGYSQQSQCLMNVAGGKYVATQNESSASGTCAKGYVKAAHTVNYGSTSSCTACTGATYAANTGQASCTACPTATNNASKATGYAYWNAGGTADHTTVTGCYVHYSNDTVDNGSASLYYCYADTDAATTGEYGVDGTSKGCWVYWDKLKCDGGYYNKNYSTSSNYDFTNKTVAKLKANACIAVEAGNWSADESLTRTACTSPLTTIGYGTAANEEADCGRKLHMGDNVVYLRSGKRTTPSLRVKVGDTTFYGALSTSLSSAMKVKNGSTEYSVVNDYQ